MYFPEEIWQIIKHYYIHNIKVHGKHLSLNPIYLKYNNVVDELKKKYKKSIYFDERVPRIIYSSKLKKYHYVKLKYGVPCPSYYLKNSNKCYLLTEYIFNFTNSHSLVYQYYKYGF